MLILFADAATSTAAQPHEGLGWLDYVALLVYLIVTFLIVVWASRKQSDTEDFFLGGRSMPWMAVGLSMMATLLSTNTYLGVPGEIIRYGINYIIGYVAYIPIILVVGFVWIPFFMRLRMTSAYEYLERRFDYRARLLGGVLFLFLRLGWMSMVVYTASLAMVEMVRGPLEAVSSRVGIAEPMFLLIGVVGLAATAYTCMGGMKAVIWTDVLQAVMLFGGVVLVIGYVVAVEGTGPTEWWNTIMASQASKSHAKIQFFSADITERITISTAILSVFFWNICTHCSDQVVLQRYFTTNSLSAALKTFIVNIASNVTIGLLLAVSGIALLYFYLQHPDFLPSGMEPTSGADKVLPYFYTHQLPMGLGGLILASFLCDAMQTLVSGVNSISAIATTDVLERAFPQRTRELTDLQLARWVTVGVGLVATILAYLLAYFALQEKATIVDLMPRTFNMFLGPLASLFIIGMFVPRATGRTAFVAVMLAMAASFTWSWWPQIPNMLASLGLDGVAEGWKGILGVDSTGKPKGPTIMLAIGAPCVFGVTLAAVLSYLFDRGGDHPGKAYSWLSVTRRPVPTFEHHTSA